MGKRHLDYKWIVLISCAFIVAIAVGINFSFGVFFKSLEADFNLSRTVTSAVYSLFLVLSPVFGVFVGWILDRRGAGVAIAMIGVFSGLSLLLTSRVTEAWQLFFTYSLLLALGIGPSAPVVMSTVARWFVEKRGLAMGIASACGSVGVMIISPAAASSIAHLGWQSSYLIIGLVAFCGITPLALVFFKAPRSSFPRINDSPSSAADFHAGKQDYGKTADVSVFNVLKTSRFWLLFAIMFISPMCIYLILTHIVPHATDLGIEPTRAAFLLSLSNGVNAAGRIFLGRLSDSIGRKKVIIASALVVAGMALWLVWARAFWSLCVFAVVFGVALGGYATPLHALVGDTFMGRNLGLIMALLELGWGFGAAAGSELGGYVFDYTGSYNYAFLIGMACMLVVAVLVLFFKPKPAT